MSMLSQTEREVLEAVMLGKKRVDEIAKYCGIPTITVESLLKRLIEKGYINYELEPTETAYEELKLVDLKHPPSYYGENVKRLLRTILNFFIIALLIWLIFVTISG